MVISTFCGCCGNKNAYITCMFINTNYSGPGTWTQDPCHITGMLHWLRYWTATHCYFYYTPPSFTRPSPPKTLHLHVGVWSFCLELSRQTRNWTRDPSNTSGIIYRLSYRATTRNATPVNSNSTTLLPFSQGLRPRRRSTQVDDPSAKVSPYLVWGKVNCTKCSRSVKCAMARPGIEPVTVPTLAECSTDWAVPN